MVKLTEVEDEHFKEKQPGKQSEPLLADDDDDYTDTDSEISTDSVSPIPDETLFDRLIALRDIIPPSSRRRITSTANTITSYTAKGLLFGGKALWIVSTSALLLGLPWALAYTEEQQILDQERELNQMKSSNEMLVPGATSPHGQQGGKPAL